MSKLSLTQKIQQVLLGILVLLLCAGCGTTKIIQTVPCSEMIPQGWEQGIEPAALPENTIGGWVTYGLVTNGKLITANDRTADTIHIYKKCEEMSRPKRRWWGLY